MHRACMMGAVIATALPTVIGAQGILGDGTARLTPQYVSYTFTQGSTKSTVSELAIPLAYVVPLTERLTLDVSTAFASSQVKAGSATSSIAGLTDTQLRVNYTFGLDAVVVTAGLNLPTGQYEVAEDRIAAAGQIGNDFLTFPVSSYGNGIAGTGGIAIARPLGEWNLGLGASVRKSAEFGAFRQDNTVLRFQPADEVRLRAGLDGFAFGGRMVVGLVYSAFGRDIAGPTTYSTGDRVIGQAALDVPLGGAQLFVSGWHLYRLKGEQIGGAAPPEGISNVNVGLGLDIGGLFLEPNVEGRFWSIDGGKAGTFGSAGLRTRITIGAVQIYPSASYGVGALNTVSGPDVDMTGFRGGLSIRVQ
jgi:hypothetical protein